MLVRLVLLASLAGAGRCADWALGIFVRDTSMLLHETHRHTANTGVVAFAASFLARTVEPRMALLVDEGTGSALAEHCAWDGSKRCVLFRESDVLPASGMPSSGDGPPRFLTHPRASLFVRRWWLYVGLMERIQALDDSAAGEGMALLSDVRDVLWQDDVFRRLRAVSRAKGVGHDTSSGAWAHPPFPPEEPLFFAVEPFNGTVKDEPTFNVPCAAQCLPPPVMARFGHMPLSCAGTTAGSWSAVQRYIRAMQAHALFCAGPGKQYDFSGMDQPMHMYLLFDLILSRHPSAAQEGEGGEVSDAQWAARYASLLGGEEQLGAYPLHPRREEEPAYAELRRVAVAQLEAQPPSAAHPRGLGRVVPLPAFHDDGEMCTVSLVPWETFFAPSESGYGDVRSRGTAGGPVCALLHQYDRHARLVKLADVLYSGVDPSTRYWDPATGRSY